MNTQDWYAGPDGALGMLLAPLASGTSPNRFPAATLLALFNRNSSTVTFTLPPGGWRQLCDSSAAAPFAERTANPDCSLAGHSVLLLARE